MYIVCFVLHFQTKTLMGEVMKEAQFSLAEANFSAGDFRYVIHVHAYIGMHVLCLLIYFSAQLCYRMLTRLK